MAFAEGMARRKRAESFTREPVRRPSHRSSGSLARFPRTKLARVLRQMKREDVAAKQAVCENFITPRRDCD
jgi:hypothetical protein